jgi:hypothetical protein
MVKDITKDFKIEFEHAMRWEQNVSTFSRIFNQVSLEYELSKYLEVAAGYRLAHREDGYHRLFMHTVVDFDINLIKVKWRNKYEYTDERPTDELSNGRLRERVELEFDLGKNKIEPAIYGELLYRTSNSKIIDQLRSVRYGIECGVPLTKRHKISLATFIEDNYRKKVIRRDFIMSVDYRYRW